MRKEIPTLNNEFDIKILFKILKQYWYVLPTLLLIAYLIAAIYFRYTIPIYKSTTIIQKSEENVGRMIDKESPTSDFLARQENPTKVINLIQSKNFLTASLSKLPLDVEYYLKGKIIDSELFPNDAFEVTYDSNSNILFDTPIYFEFLNKNKLRIHCNSKRKTFSYDFTISQTESTFKTKDFSLTLKLKTGLDNLIGNTYYVIFISPAQRNEKYISKLSAYPSEKVSQGIEISIYYPNAKKGSMIINAITEDFFQYYTLKCQESYIQVLNYLDNQLEFWENEVYHREENLDNYKRSNNFIDPNDKSLDELSKSIEEYTSRLATIEQEERKLHAIENSFSTDDPYKLMAKIIGNNMNGNVGACIDKLQQLLIEKENLQYNYTTSSGKIQNINYQINVQTNALKEIIHTNIESLRNEKADIKAKLNKSKGILQNQEDFANIMDYKKLQRLASTSNSYYEQLLASRVSYTIMKASTTNPFIILQSATPEMSESTINKKTFYVISFFIAIIIALVFLIIKYLNYNIIDSADDIKKYTDTPYLGSIPFLNNLPESKLLVDVDPKALVLEEFRRIRANLNFMDNTEGSKVVANTSTTSGEGKTFVIVNLAGIVAYSGKKVIVLDCDMRKPKIHKAFSTAEKPVHNYYGVSDILIGEKKWQDCIHECRLPNLFFITAGSIPPNPSELILSKNMDTFITELKQNYDFIFIDNPPIGLVSDAAVCLQLADYPLYIFKENYSIKPFIANLNDLYDNPRIKNLGFILNGSSHGSDGYGRYGRYGKYGKYGQETTNQDLEQQETSWKNKILSSLKKISKWNSSKQS
ncbi:MAG: polysaccharide biosynthesis tyrosine autokinase [Bacteroidales bacterium]|nr:polysaccharide biosynthesis tyrosine autokinase [Bacteroidales bacterium]